ncbi:MAG: hypothetical protein KAR35_06890 [Candidatus Heimdallarchaeota archaeon]|nr:hypothetical protein [Candidatus Heimdallarchaeota archaeon]MCK5049085.1 hypothetical protein [Candidatus Heimdallarchaeota archaeon]
MSGPAAYEDFNYKISRLREKNSEKLWQQHQIMLVMLIPLSPIKNSHLRDLIKFFQEEVGLERVVHLSRDDLSKQLRLMIKDEILTLRAGKFLLTELGRESGFMLLDRLDRDGKKAWSKLLKIGRRLLHTTEYNPSNFDQQLKTARLRKRHF